MRPSLLLITLSAAIALGGCQSPSAPAQPATGTAGPPPSTQATIRGSAFYREKILLPPDVELRVQLIDNRLADTQQAVIAQQAFRGMPGPPYAFALRYDPARLRADGGYGLHAGLYSPGGELLFVTDTRVPVTPGSADPVEFRLTRVDATAAGDPAPSGETRWQCNEMIVATRFKGDVAEIRTPGIVLRLRQQSSGSGATYGDTDGNAFRMKGDNATFTMQGENISDEVRRECTRTGRSSPWDDARARGVALRAAGNEPGWIVEVDRGETPRLRAELDYGERRLEVAAAQPLPSQDGTGGFRGRAEDGGQVELRIRRERCHDDMSGHPYPASAELLVGGRTYRGCAAYLDE